MQAEGQERQRRQEQGEQPPYPTGRITLKRLRDKLRNEKRKLKRMKKKGIPIERIEEHYRCVRANMKKGSRSDLRKLDHYYKELFNEGN